MKLHQNNGKSAGFLWFLPRPGGRGFAFVISFICVCNNLYAESVCPTGMVPYTGPAITQMENLNGECTDLCDAGVRAIVAENGTRIDLFKTASTTRKMVANYGDSMCYADVVEGSQEGALNVDIDGVVHYVVPSKWQICPPKYTLSYDCGDADSGVPPENQVITYGHEFNVGAGNGSCYKAGYYISGWKIGTATYTNRTAAVWTWTEDKVATAVWSKRSYGIGYLCNNCEYPYVLRGANDQGANKGYLDVWTPPTPTWCKYPGNATFKGWDVYSVANKDLGTFVPAGESVTFEWLHNIVMRAVWEWDRNEGEYQLTFDCGTDDDGNKYGWGDEDAAITVGYNELFSPASYNTRCSREGHYVSGWTVGNTETVIDPYTATRYSWKADTTLHAVWTPQTYIIAYDCDAGSDETDAYIQVQYGDVVTLADNICVNPPNGYPCIFEGWELYLNYGWSFGTAPAGESFIWEFTEDATLRADWNCPI